MPDVWNLIRNSANTLIESNAVLEFLQPDLYLFVADTRVAEWKASARRFVPLADALVFTGGAADRPEWRAIPVTRRIGAPAPEFWSYELAELLRTANSIPDQVGSSEQIL
jgi:hypothetical protein